ncbi:uncharacterized protein LOC108111267 [Drosophila eugracilis]|uniref:uncharacterized protein LOC108111267 n=1 Tax=Drosophila eugracilis TaxID=29029 RepID=UPI0007E6A674|nr:uncharacterized protein LOC108111267 [Drosophila eugracilis]
MDEMRQVSRTVATVALLLLILPRPALLYGQSEESHEGEQIEHEIEGAMGNMERHFESGNGINHRESNAISKAFVKLGRYIKKKTESHGKPGSSGAIITFQVLKRTNSLKLISVRMKNNKSDLEKLISADPDKKVFNIKPADNAHIQFSFQPSKGNKPSSDKKKKEPEYFLNFVFNNYRNPKKSLDRKTLSKKVKMRRTARRLLPNGIPNPYKYFPLKGDDM